MTIRTVMVSLLMSLIGALWNLQPAAQAVTIEVGGGCSLADAVTAANEDSPVGGCPAGNGPDTIILFDSVVLSSQVDFTGGNNGLPSVRTNITLEGNNNLIWRDTSAPDFRIFHVSDSGDLTLKDVTISNGLADGPDPFGGLGGGLYNVGGDVSIIRSVFSFNVSSSSGGGLLNAYLPGSVGTVTIIDSTFEFNVSHFGGAISNFDRLIVDRSTISANLSQLRAGGIENIAPAVAQLTNSTVSGNASVRNAGGIYNDAALLLTHCTLVGNTAGQSGGSIYVLGTAVSTILVNSLIGFSDGGNCRGDLSAIGTNLADDTSCGADVIPILTGVDPELKYNGGLSQTHKLLPGSNAIDGAGPCELTTDQRQVARDASCDVGSYESEMNIFSDGFESGDLSAWSDVMGLRVDVSREAKAMWLSTPLREWR